MRRPIVADMLTIAFALLCLLIAIFRTATDLRLEIFALRHQWACSGANDPADSIWSTVTGSSGFGFIDFGRAASRHYSSSSRRLSCDGIGLVSGSIGIGARNPAARDGRRSTERFAT